MTPPRAEVLREAALLLVLSLLAPLLLAFAPASVEPPRGAAYSTPSPPIVLVLQPDAANGTDTHIAEATPDWNFGTDSVFWVGRDPGDGSPARSLAGFDLAAIPTNATVVDASLEMYQLAGGAGTVQLRRASAPWVEGPGGGPWVSLPITVRETAGQRRTGEPVLATLSFPPGSIVDPARDLRVWRDGVEVPSQVRPSFSGGQVTGATLVFSVTVAAGGVEAYSVTYSANGTSVPAYRSKGFGAAPIWTSPPVGTGASGVSVADLTDTGSLDLVFGTSDGFVTAITAAGTVRWSTRVSASQSVPFPPQLVDLDRDGSTDIVAVANDPALVRLNATGSVVWSVPLSRTPYSTPTVLDVDGDGVLDLLVGRDAPDMGAFSGVDGTFLRGFTGGVGQFTASVLDLDGDGRGEFFFGGDDKKLHAYDAGGVMLWSRGPGGTSSIVNSVAVGDVDGDGVPDIVSGDSGDNGWEFALNATDGSTLWSIVFPSLRHGHQTLADLDLDGALEVVFGLRSGPLYALRGRDGSTAWSYSGGTSQASAPAVVDLDNDGIPEVIYLDQGSTVRVLNATGGLVHSWTIVPNDPGLVPVAQPDAPQQAPMVTPAVADLDGDGTLEVIVPTGSGIQAFGTGGLDHDWRTFGYNWNHTHRAGDGSSPDGVPFLAVTVGAETVHAASGASWDLRDGVTAWLAPGGDYGVPEANATTTSGWNAWNVTRLVRDWFGGTYPNVGFFLTEADEASGGFHGFASSDAANGTVRPRLVVTYTIPLLDSTPRIVARIPDLSLPEDGAPFALDLAGFAADDDTPTTGLRWNVSGLDPGIVQVSGTNVPAGVVLTFRPQPDAWGNARVTYWLTDPEGHASSQRAWVNITPVNDPPAFNPPTTFVVHFDKTYRFDFGPYVADVDTPRPELSLIADDPAHATASGFNVSFLYPLSYLDRWAFVGLTVSDGTASAARVVAVKVTADDPPVLTRPLPDLVMSEGEQRLGVFDLDDYFTDPNNDVLFFSEGATHLDVTIHPGNHSVDLDAETNWYGVEQVTFRGTDPAGAIAEDAILVTVLPVDDPPVLGPVPDLVVHYGADYSFDLQPYISDPDTALDAINASASGPYANVSGHLMVLNYPFALNGTVQPLTIWIGDGVTVVSRTIRVSVTDDWPPVLRGKLPDRTFLEDTAYPNAYDLQLFFEDPDSTALFYSSGNVNVRVTIDPSGIVDLNATRDWFGTERVTFRATDGVGALAEDTVWVTVVPVDDAPAFRPIPTVYLNGFTGLLDLAPYLVDVDTNVSSLVVVAASGNVTVVGQTLVFNYAGPARESVELVVSDGLLTARTTLTVVAAAPPGTEVIPGYLFWLAAAVAGIVGGGFVLYRRRQVEWVFLVNDAGLLVSSVTTRSSGNIDPDLMTSMLTAIMDFAKASFSDETHGGLEALELGDRKVEIERADRSFLAVVYRGRAPGALPRLMKALLRHLEARYPAAFTDIVDASTLEDIPIILQRFATRAWWPFLSFPAVPEAEGNRSG